MATESQRDRLFASTALRDHVLVAVQAEGDRVLREETPVATLRALRRCTLAIEAVHQPGAILEPFARAAADADAVNGPAFASDATTEPDVDGLDDATILAAVAAAWDAVADVRPGDESTPPPEPQGGP